MWIATCGIPGVLLGRSRFDQQLRLSQTATWMVLKCPKKCLNDYDFDIIRNQKFRGMLGQPSWGIMK